MTRPEKKAEHRRTEVLTVRFKKSERAAVEACAHALMLDTANFVRQAALEKVARTGACNEPETP